MARSIAASAATSSRNRSVLLLAALFGVLSAGMMFAFLSSRGGDGTSVQDALRDTGEVESVVVLARDVEFGTTITPDMLTTRPVPVSALLPGAETDASNLVGKVSTTRLFAGEQVIPGKVTTFNDQTTLAFKVPEGMRALSLQVPHEAWVNAGLPQPGDRVDVLAITTLNAVDPLTGQEKPEVLSGIIAEDIMVLAAAQTVVNFVPATESGTVTGAEGGTEPSTATGTGDSSEPAYRPLGQDGTYETAISVTLAVTPEQAARIAIIDAMKDDQGQYRLLTRQQGDRAPIEGTNTWTLDDVFIRN
jgi:pilus assembly protein CpaB